jgi:ribonuclease HI
VAGIAPIDIIAKESGKHRYLRLKSKDVDEKPVGVAAGHPRFINSITYKHYSSHFKVSDLNIFTDGSKTDNHVGFSFIVYDNKEKIIASNGARLEQYCSVHQSELFGIFKALEFIKDLPTKINSVSIITDSRSSLEAIKSYKLNNSIVFNIKRMINLIQAMGTRLNFYWCKAHVGTIGNETADKLAKNTINAPILYSKKPISNFTQAKYSAISKAWSDLPVNINDGLILSIWPTNQDRIKDKYKPCWKYFHHFLTGHGPFRTKIFRFKDNPDCHCGTGLHNAMHVLNDCPLSIVPRRTILNLANSTDGRCDNAVLKLFKKSSRRFCRINQLLRRIQELSRPSFLEDGWDPP